MILSHDHKFVFISTPKTGSHTFFTLLTNDYFHGERLGPLYHRRDMPEDVDGYTVFSTCRNPYERAVALWHSVLHIEKEDRYRKTWLSVLDDDSFLSFCRYLAQRRMDIETIRGGPRLPMIAVPQWRWYQGMPGDTIPLHLENFEEEFNALPFITEHHQIPHVLKREHASFDELKTPEITDCINHWAEHDFKRFGYKRITT